MKKAFTLIELLVVIAIIALLSTLSVVALNSARAKSRDARRLSDIKNTQTALEMYFDTAGEYPATLMAGNELSYGGLVFLAKVPSDPLGSNQYNYAQTESGQSYTLDFTVESKAGDYEPGNYQATPKGILAGGSGSTPPETFVCGDNLMDGLEQYTTAGKSGYCWMTQSLVRDSNKRICFKDDCTPYGGLYSWMNKDNLCPPGWRLPSSSDKNNGLDWGLVVGTEKQNFPDGYHDGYDFVWGLSLLLLEDKGKFLNVNNTAGDLVTIDLNSAVSVRCIKEL
jgi:prepilin-type N-terminal cleavage/methylation domain-containing protein